MPEFETPLENLFLYIRDIFGNPTTCTDFEKEKNNEKAKDINYWDIGSLYDIAKKAKHKNVGEFEFALTFRSGSFRKHPFNNQTNNYSLYTNTTIRTKRVDRNKQL